MATCTVYQLLPVTDQVSSRLCSNDHIFLEHIPIMDETQGKFCLDEPYRGCLVIVKPHGLALYCRVQASRL